MFLISWLSKTTVAHILNWVKLIFLSLIWFCSALFHSVASLGVGASTSVLMGINFNDTTQPAALEVCAGEQKFKVSITAPVGELLQPHTMSEGDFSNQQSECPSFPLLLHLHLWPFSLIFSGSFSTQQSECPSFPPLLQLHLWSAVVVNWYIMPSQLQSCQSKVNFAKSQGKVIHCSLWASLFEGLRRIGKNEPGRQKLER